MISKILSSEKARGKTRLIFQHEYLKVVYGPYVEFRPEKEDHAAWVASHGESLLASLNAPQPDPAKELLASLLTTDEAVLKQALAIDDAKLAALRTKAESEKV